MPVALMTVANAVAGVRSATAHDSDTQVTDAQITSELDGEYRTLRRLFSQWVPNLYQKQTTATILSGNNTISKPDDFERVVRIEIQYAQSYWQPLMLRPALEAQQGIAGDVAGTYRITYITRPVDGYTSFDLPEGAERILVQRVAAWVRQRHEEDPGYHMAKAQQLQDDIRRSLVMRYGAHPITKLAHQDWGNIWRSFFEEGDHFVIV